MGGQFRQPIRIKIIVKLQKCNATIYYIMYIFESFTVMFFKIVGKMWHGCVQATKGILYI